MRPAITGAGVVLDSDPESERVETVNKAMALFRAAEDATGNSVRD